MCLLQVYRDGDYVYMFNQEFNLAWNELNVALAFAENYSLDLELATKRFNKTEFWEAITTLYDCNQPRPNEIHNPNLHFIHRWQAITLFPRSDIIPLRTDDLRLLYAMVH
jgi:hypothetical protein